MKGSVVHACAALGLVSACGGAGASAPPASSPVAAPLMTSSTSKPAPHDEPSPFTVSAEGELLIPGAITFRVRPLAGPGSMGPTELAPESEAALAHVRRYMEAHPAETVRVECAINVMKTSSGPNKAYAVGLARQVTRWLVDHGAPCTRLEAVGRFERAHDAPVEKVRILVRWDAREPDAREDPCKR